MLANSVRFGAIFVGPTAYKVEKEYAYARNVQSSVQLLLTEKDKQDLQEILSPAGEITLAAHEDRRHGNGFSLRQGEHQVKAMDSQSLFEKVFSLVLRLPEAVPANVRLHLLQGLVEEGIQKKFQVHEACGPGAYYERTTPPDQRGGTLL